MMRVVGVRQGVTDDDLDALIQDVRVRIWRAHQRGEAIDRLPTSYVYRTAMAAAVDMVRKRRREWSRESALQPAMTSAVAVSKGTDADVLAADLGAAIDRVLRDMPESRRVVVRMHLSGYEREEMATMLQRTEASVRNLLYRGMQDLRDGLVRAGYRWPEDA